MTKAASKKGPTTKTVDSVARMHRAALDKLKSMSPKQVFNVAVNAGIYTKDGKLTQPYQPKVAGKKSTG